MDIRNYFSKNNGKKSQPSEPKDKDDRPKEKTKGKQAEKENKALNKLLNKQEDSQERPKRKASKKTIIIEESDEDKDEAFEPNDENNRTEDEFLANDDQPGFNLKSKSKIKSIKGESSASKKETKGSKTEIKSKKDDIDKAEENIPSVKKKFNYWAAKSATPSALGSKPIPKGKEGILVGSTFVLTGQLSSITREDTMDLIKRCGGRITSAVSSKTTYLIIGEEPGESKLKKAESLNTKTMDEDQFFAFIREKSGEDEEQVEELKQEIEAEDNFDLNKSVKEIVKEIHEENKNKLLSKPTQSNNNSESTLSGESKLWVDKYKPTSLAQVIGNNKKISEMVTWLKQWNPDPDAKSGIPRAILISGPPGIGKTTAAHLACKEAGYNPIELNASDTRNKKSIESMITQLINNHTIGQYFKSAADKATPAKDLLNTQKPALILDEVDGMSGGDRGGVAEIIKLLKKTKIPMICICNDRQSTKVRSLANHCLDLRFFRPTASQIKPVITNIVRREELTLSDNVIEKMVEMSQSDIRQILNLLSTWRLSKTNMTYDQGKDYSKLTKKDTILNPFEIMGKYFNVSNYNSSTLADRIDLYFHDFSIVPLMVQENYIKCHPLVPRNNSNRPLDDLEKLERVASAADFISQADLIDNSIHGGQNWELMPIHAAFSCAIPAYYVHGSMEGMYQFPGWLGQNSKANKSNRLLREAHLHMMSKISGNKSELRQSYLQTLIYKLYLPLTTDDDDKINKVITVMDNYFLDKDDWEGLISMMLGKYKAENILKAIPTKIKSEFTRTYNKTSHPIAIRRLAQTSKAVKGSDVTVDNDEILGEEETLMEEIEDEEQDSDLEMDKLITKKEKPIKGKKRDGEKIKNNPKKSKK